MKKIVIAAVAASALGFACSGFAEEVNADLEVDPIGTQAAFSDGEAVFVTEGCRRRGGSSSSSSRSGGSRGYSNFPRWVLRR